MQNDKDNLARVDGLPQLAQQSELPRHTTSSFAAPVMERVEYYKQVVVTDVYGGEARYSWWLREPRGGFKRWVFRKALNWCEALR